MKHIYSLLLAAAMLVPTFATAQNASTELTNLVIFVRFADDEEIDHPFDSIDAMFNSRQEGYYSVYNYYDAMTYGRIHYNTVYTSNVQNGVIVSYRDTLPRGAYQPWSETNPIGYQSASGRRYCGPTWSISRTTPSTIPSPSTACAPTRSTLSSRVPARTISTLASSATRWGIRWGCRTCTIMLTTAM